MQYEDTVRIATPEGVELELPLAGIGSRLTARILDHLIQAAIFVAAILIFTSSVDTESSGEAVVAIIGILIGFAIFWVYDVAFEAFAGGRTPGKRAVGLRVVGLRGEPIGFPAAAVRNLLRLVDEYLTLWIVALISMIRSDRNQRVGDMAAGTMVVRESAPRRRAPRFRSASRISTTSSRRRPGTRPRSPTPSWRRPDAFSSAGTRWINVARAKLAADIRDRLQPKVGGSEGVRSAEQFVEILVAVKARRG